LLLALESQKSILVEVKEKINFYVRFCLFLRLLIVESTKKEVKSGQNDNG
jgi:hypothetical protein